jgi:nucleotide-binding universal stress UspA family protein
MHGPKSILLHLDSSASSVVRSQAARSVAEAFDAEVTALYCVTPALMRYPYSLESMGQVVADLQRLDDERKARTREVFENLRAGSSRLRWEESESPWSFRERSLYADLVILGRQLGSDAKGEDPGSGDVPFDFVPHVLVRSGRPALVIPPHGPVNPMGNTILVAWKQTRESARAVAAALPWLQRARNVHVVSYDADNQLDAALLQKQLEGHGVSAEFHRSGSGSREVGESLLSRASELKADLLVMGCYGHSRSYEWVLGGATKTILQSTTVPVFMVH